MPKLDLPNAVRIKTESGEVTRLKGSAFNWSSPHYSGADHATLTGDFKRGHYVADDSKVDTLDQAFDYSGGLGTMTDSDGVLKWQPHNLLAYSEDFTQSDWTAGYSGIAAYSLVSTGIEDPSGGSNATTLSFPAVTGAGDVSVIRQSYTTAATQYAGSLWVKATAASDVGKKMFAYISTVSSYTELTLTSEWQEISFTETATAALGLVSFGVLGSTYGGANQDSFNVDIWGAHFYRSDLGGMVAVPVAERGLSTSATYLPTKADPIPAAPELVTNGTFDTDTDWTKGTGWTIGSGVASHAAGSSSEVSQNITTVVGKAYVATVDITAISGSGWGVTIRKDGSTINTFLNDGSTTGSLTATFVATDVSTSVGVLQGSGGTVSIDNISVKELRYDPSSPRYLPRVGEHKYDSTTAKWNAHNLLTYSEEFDNAAWLKLQSGDGVTPTVTANAGTAPDGTTTADRVEASITVNSGANYSYLRQADSSWPDSINRAIWIKSNTGSDQTFALVATSSPSLVTATNTWTKVEFETTSGSAQQFDISVGGGIGTDDALDILVWGAHLYRSDLNGVVANSGNDVSGLYVPTTTTATEPTLNTEVSYKNKGLRLESEARTNLLTYSQDFTNAAWAKGNTGTLAVDATGPDGETSAVTLIDSGATGTGSVFINEDLAGLSAIPYTFSVFLKEDQLSWASLDIVSFGIAAGSPSIRFDLGSGALGTGASGVEHRIEDYGDGWYRCSATFTSVNTTGTVRIRLADSDSDLNLDLDGTSSILIYGAQFEAGDTPSTYMPTTGATFTRPAETFETPAGTAPWSGISNTTVRREADYVSGYLPTDTKGAWLSDTDDADVTGTELVTNGDFATDITGWTENNVTTSVVSGVVELTDAGSSAQISQVVSVTAGKRYVLTAQAKALSTNTGVNTAAIALFNDGTTTFDLVTAEDVFQDLEREFTAGTSTVIVYLQVNGGSNGDEAHFDNVSVRLADPDRSTNDNGLAINGTITKTPVATGAELVAYSGFSASNYLEQPYNSDLDFGTGDFCVMGWVKQASGSVDILLSKSPASSIVSPYFELQLQSDGTIDWPGNNSTSKLSSSSDVCTDEWRFICVVRDSGTGRLFVDGTLEASAANTDDYDHSNADTLRVGYRQDSYAGTLAGSLALLRIAGSAPTTAEILEIYNREKVLFEDGTTASRVIDTELVTNGDFATGDTSGWTEGAVSTSVSSGVVTVTNDGGTNQTIFENLTTEVGKTYIIEGTPINGTGSARIYYGGSFFSIPSTSATFTATSTTTAISLLVLGADGTSASFSGISVKEYTPAAITDMQTPEVTIGIKGEMDYVDGGVSVEKTFYEWELDSNNEIFGYLSTFGGLAGSASWIQKQAATLDSVTEVSPGSYSPGLNVPFNIASYHEVNKINGAVDGTALTANTTPVSLPDLSATDLQWGYDFMGTIEYINVWDTSEEDTGIVYITE